MGNDMFNDEQLAHAEIVQKETEDALGWWKDRALKAEAKLADKYLIEEQYEAACGDRDGLLRMVETLREQKNALLAERDAALPRARETEDGAVREAAERLAGVLRVRRERSGCGDLACDAVTHEAQHLLSALSSPPRPETKDDAVAEDESCCYHCGASHWCSECERP